MFLVKYIGLITKLFWAILIVISVNAKYFLKIECSKSQMTPVPNNGIMLKSATTQLMTLQEGWIPR